jgi:hypothetical protein
LIRSNSSGKDGFNGSPVTLIVRLALAPETAMP